MPIASSEWSGWYKDAGFFRLPKSLLGRDKCQGMTSSHAVSALDKSGFSPCGLLFGFRERRRRGFALQMLALGAGKEL